MDYPFVCPNCKNEEIISMRITEYVGTGHKCKQCGEELQREVSSLVCGLSIDKTNSFYRRCN